MLEKIMKNKCAFKAYSEGAFLGLVVLLVFIILGAIPLTFFVWLALKEAGQNQVSFFSLMKICILFSALIGLDRIWKAFVWGVTFSLNAERKERGLGGLFS